MDTATTLDTSSAPTTATDADPALAALLDAELAFSPHARNGFINHLAMSLVAARRLGADDAELQRWFDEQVAEDDFLVPRDRPDWLDGEIATVAALGIPEAVRRELPALMSGLPSQFFHSVIRLELAVDAGHVGQVANALRNWRDDPAARLPDPPSGAGAERIDDVLGRLAADPRRSAVRGSIRRAAEEGWVRAELDTLAADDRLLDDVVRAAAASHTDLRDFGTLHMVTGARASRSLAPLLDPDTARQLALRAAQALAAAHVAFAAPAPGEGASGDGPGDDELPDWDEVAIAARATDDPHVTKITYACRLQQGATGDPLFRRVAARQAGILGPT